MQSEVKHIDSAAFQSPCAGRAIRDDESHTTILSLKKVFPNARIVKQDDVLTVVQTDKQKQEFFVVPAKAQQSYETFAHGSAYEFLSFMHALTYLCQQANKMRASKQMEEEVFYHPEMQASQEGVDGYAAYVRLCERLPEPSKRQGFQGLRAAIEANYGAGFFR